MAEEPMAPTCPQAIPVSRYQLVYMLLPLFAKHYLYKLYSEATITAFANKFQQITLYQQQHPPCL
jgi:hypothetical protein